MSKPLRSLTALLAITFIIAIAATAALIVGALPTTAAETAAAPHATDAVAQWAMIAAAIAAGLSSLAAGYAVASVGSAAVGALAEKPELLGRVLILVGLAEGIAIYGLIVAILILNRAG